MAESTIKAKEYYDTHFIKLHLYVAGTGSSKSTIIQNIIDACPPTSQTKIIEGTHQASGIRMFHGYLYSDNSYGAIVVYTYGTAFLGQINNGVITVHDISLV